MRCCVTLVATLRYTPRFQSRFLGIGAEVLKQYSEESERTTFRSQIKLSLAVDFAQPNVLGFFE